jgi:Carboxypeptidase regulatory-like domain
LKFSHVIRLLLFLLCAAPFDLAQSPDATMSGVVVDTAGRTIPDAAIEILNDATDVHYSRKTNGIGIYTVSALPPGQYCVQVSKAGFKTLIKPDVVLNVQSALSLNFTLPVGATSESITVEAGEIKVRRALHQHHRSADGVAAIKGKGNIHWR